MNRRSKGLPYRISERKRNGAATGGRERGRGKRRKGVKEKWKDEDSRGRENSQMNKGRLEEREKGGK